MTRTVDFQIDPSDFTFLDSGQVTSLVVADIESDEDGSYFKLTGLRWENCRVEPSDWRWACIAEWVQQDALRPFGIVRSKHAEPADIPAIRADDIHDQRMNAAA